MQFESIHPFLDGNGRLGRLLIPFVMIVEGALSSPLLYLSLHFKSHRQEYYDTLDRVRTHGDWEGWLAFYLDGVSEVSDQAIATATKLVALFKEHAAAIQGLGRAKHSALRVHELLKKRCIVSVPVASKELGLTFPAVNKALKNLQGLGFVKEISGKQRHRVFSYVPCLETLQTGMGNP